MNCVYCTTMDKMHLKINQRTSLRMIPTTQLQLTMKIMQLSTIDLRNEIAHELEQNPVLEESPPVSETAENNEESSTERENTSDEMFQYFEDSSDSGYSGYRVRNDVSDNKQQFIEGVLTRPESLIDHLLQQMHLSSHDEKEYAIGEFLISNINDEGYITIPFEEIAGSSKYSIHELETVLKTIQTFDPNGVGARNLRECLLIQIRQLPEKKPIAERIIDKYFLLLSQRKTDQIAKKMKLPKSIINEALECIMRLNPKPGHEYDTKKVEYVVPDVSVIRHGDSFRIIMNDEWIPKIRVNSYYHSLIRNRGTKLKIKKFLREKYYNAIQLIKSIEQRRNTLYKVTASLLTVQQEFFNHGSKHIKPLTLREIADMIDMHESTISRATSGKYIQTPWGIFELKYFFSSKIASKSGAALSSQSVKEIIKDIIENESGRGMSDKKIVEMLSELGIKIARRTVTKYRKKLGILPSNLRKTGGK